MVNTLASPREPEWADSTTGLEMWKNPLIPMADRLLIADGTIAFERKVVANLRDRLKIAEGAQPRSEKSLIRLTKAEIQLELDEVGLETHEYGEELIQLIENVQSRLEEKNA